MEVKRRWQILQLKAQSMIIPSLLLLLLQAQTQRALPSVQIHCQLLFQSVIRHRLLNQQHRSLVHRRYPTLLHRPLSSHQRSRQYQARCFLREQQISSMTHWLENHCRGATTATHIHTTRTSAKLEEDGREEYDKRGDLDDRMIGDERC